MIGFTETWMTDEICYLYGIEGYVLYKNSSQQGRGGVGLFIAQNVKQNSLICFTHAHSYRLSIVRLGSRKTLLRS